MDLAVSIQFNLSKYLQLVAYLINLNRCHLQAICQCSRKFSNQHPKLHLNQYLGNQFSNLYNSNNHPCNPSNLLEEESNLVSHLRKLNNPNKLKELDFLQPTLQLAQAQEDYFPL